MIPAKVYPCHNHGKPLVLMIPEKHNALNPKTFYISALKCSKKVVNFGNLLAVYHEGKQVAIHRLSHVKKDMAGRKRKKRVCRSVCSSSSLTSMEILRHTRFTLAS